jgi:short-subunit dehydrogenase
MRAALAAMLAPGGGGIVNVASVAGLRGQEHLGRG